MPDFVVTTAFKSRDQVTRNLQRMGVGVDRFGREARRSFGAARRSALSFRSVLGGILGAAVISRGVGALGQAVGGVTREFLDFDDAITAASVKFGVLDRNAETFRELARTARDVGAATEFTAPQAAEGLKFLAKAGWSATDAMAALPSFVDLATASDMEFSRAADIATDVMGAFQLAAGTTAERLTSLTRVNDVLSKAVNMSNIDMEDLFETIKYGGPIATAAGVSIEKFAGMAAWIGGAGIKGSQGGTALRSMLLSMVAPTAEAIGLFKKFRIQLRTAKGDLIDPVKILGELSKKFSKLGTAQQAAALKILFGKTAVSGATVSIAGANRALGQFEDSLKAAGGGSRKVAEAMRQSLSRRLEALKSAAIELGLKVFDAFSNKFPGGIDAAIEAVRNFDATKIVDAINEAIDVGKKLVAGFKAAIEVGRDYEGVLVGIGAAFAGWKLAGIVVSLGKVSKIMKGMAAAGGLRAAVGAGGVAGSLGVIGLVIFGLSAGIHTVVTRWKDLKQAVGWLVEDIGAALFRLATAVGDTFSDIWLSIRSGFATLLKWIASGARFLGLNAIFDVSKIDNYADEVKRSSVAAAAEMANAMKVVRQLGGRPGLDRSYRQRRVVPVESMATGAADAFFMPSAAQSGMSMERVAGPGLPVGRLSDFYQSPAADKSLARNLQKAASERRSASEVEFHGRLDIAGAPPGSRVESQTRGAPPIRTELLGAN